jgi:hypothetical protein
MVPVSAAPSPKVIDVALRAVTAQLLAVVLLVQMAALGVVVNVDAKAIVHEVAAVPVVIVPAMSVPVTLGDPVPQEVGVPGVEPLLCKWEPITTSLEPPPIVTEPVVVPVPIVVIEALAFCVIITPAVLLPKVTVPPVAVNPKPAVSKPALEMLMRLVPLN